MGVSWGGTQAGEFIEVPEWFSCAPGTEMHSPTSTEEKEDAACSRQHIFCFLWGRDKRRKWLSSVTLRRKKEATGELRTGKKDWGNNLSNINHTSWSFSFPLFIFYLLFFPSCLPYLTFSPSLPPSISFFVYPPLASVPSSLPTLFCPPPVSLPLPPLTSLFSKKLSVH